MKNIFASLAFAYAASAQALDSISAGIGSGDRDAAFLGIAAQWRHDIVWLADTRWRLYREASLARWDVTPGTIYDLGLTPVFRYARDAAHGPYAEAAIGLHLLTGSTINRDVTLSTRFQFGDHVGLGYRFERYDVSLRLQHLSNAGIRNPNPGINFLELRAQYWLR